MLRHQPQFEKSSYGERGVFFAYGIISLFGAGLSFLVVNQLGGSADILRPLGIYDVWTIISGAVGAAMGLYVGRRWLGSAGLSGWVKAMIAIPVISFIASLAGGTLALPIYGTMFGPMALAVTFYENVIVLVFWVWTVLIAHVLFTTHRKERDSLFIDLAPSEF